MGETAGTLAAHAAISDVLEGCQGYRCHEQCP